MDPVAIAAKTRYKDPKPKSTSSEWTPFQRKLHMNPWAHLLSSSLRHCALSFARMPSSFQVTFHPTPHPEIGSPWLMPRALLSPEGPPHGSAVRVFVRRQLLALAQKKGIRQRVLRPELRRFLGKRANQLVWREDMPDVVLKTLQDEVRTKLRWCFVHPNAGLVARHGDVPVGDGDPESAKHGAGVDESEYVRDHTIEEMKACNTKTIFRESRKPTHVGAILFLVPITIPTVTEISQSLCGIDTQLKHIRDELKPMLGVINKLSKQQGLEIFEDEHERYPAVIPTGYKWPMMWVDPDQTRTQEDLYRGIGDARNIIQPEFVRDAPAGRDLAIQDESSIEKDSETSTGVQNGIRSSQNLVSDGVAEGVGFPEAERTSALHQPLAGINDGARPVPVYQLHEYLGEEGIKALVNGTTFENARAVALMESPLTVAAHIALFKLQSYFVEDYL